MTAPLEELEELARTEGTSDGVKILSVELGLKTVPLQTGEIQRIEYLAACPGCRSGTVWTGVCVPNRDGIGVTALLFVTCGACGRQRAAA